MAIGECGVCGRWSSGTSLPSSNKRPDGTTPMDNFVCYRCQEQARVFGEVDFALEHHVRRAKSCASNQGGTWLKIIN
jgi:hypothetical protein